MSQKTILVLYNVLESSDVLPEEEVTRTKQTMVIAYFNIGMKQVLYTKQRIIICGFKRSKYLIWQMEQVHQRHLMQDLIIFIMKMTMHLLWYTEIFSLTKCISHLQEGGGTAKLSEFFVIITSYVVAAKNDTHRTKEKSER